MKLDTIVLRGKISKRKHPRVDTTTTGKAIQYEREIHIQCNQLLVYPQDQVNHLAYSLSKVCPTPLESNSLSKALKPLRRFPCLAIVRIPVLCDWLISWTNHMLGF